MQKPDVEYIEGLSPAISIDQKSSGHNPRSTVGTVTEISDYLRLLFARIGKPYDPKTGKVLESQSVQEIVDKIVTSKSERKVMILSPIIKNRKGTYEELFQRFLNKGFVRVRVDNEIHNLEEDIKLDRYKIHNIEIVIDRLVIKPEYGELNKELNKVNTNLSEELKTFKEFRKRVTDSVELALSLSEGSIILNDVDSKKDTLYSESFVLSDGSSFPKLEPNLFSFNAPAGACPTCAGLGTIRNRS